MFTATRVLTFATLASTALAQQTVLNQLQLPAQCQTAITNLTADSEISTCLGFQNIEAVTAQFLGNATDSLVGPLNTWLTGVCSVPQCSDAALKKIIDGLTTQCELDVTVATEVITYYPVVRNALCLQQGTTNCITQTLTSVEKIVGALNAAKITALVYDPSTASQLASATGAYCTDCVKGIYSTLVAGIPVFAQAGYTPIFQQQCGASFTDGTIPAGILTSSNGTTTNTTSGTSANAKSGSARAVSMLSQSTLVALGASAIVILSTFA